MLRTCALPFGDYYVKVLRCRLFGRRTAPAGKNVATKDAIVSGFDGKMRARKRLRVDLMRGPSDRATRRREEFRQVVEERTPSASSTQLPWVDMAAILRDSAEKTVWREPRRGEVPLLEAWKPEGKRSRELLMESWNRVRRAQRTEREQDERARHRVLRKGERRKERTFKRQLMEAMVAELEEATRGNDMGRFTGR